MNRLYLKAKRQKPSIIAGLFLLTISFGFTACGKGPQILSADANSGNCPVCQMKVEASDPWSAEIYYVDGTKLLFETFGDLLIFHSAPERYVVTEKQKDREQIDKIVVKDYRTKSQIDAKQATLVYKSKVDGPMGPDVIAFIKREDAAAFAAANGGSLVALSQMTPEMVQNLRKK